MEEEVQLRGWGVASLVFAVFSLLFIILPFFGILFALVALILSFIQHDRLSRGAKKIALISLVINAVALLLFAAVLGMVLQKTSTALGDIRDLREKVKEASTKMDNQEDKVMKVEPPNMPTGQEQDFCKGYCVDSPRQCSGMTEQRGCGGAYCCLS